MKVKVEELKAGPKLDWLVAKAMGHMAKQPALEVPLAFVFAQAAGDEDMHFSSSGDATLALMKSELVSVYYENKRWEAATFATAFGETPEEAVAKCVVISKLGPNVELPEEGWEDLG